ENGSLINVGGLYAAAGKISDEDFTNRRKHFTDLAGDAFNSGTINSKRDVVLAGANVANFGSIVSDKGLVAMQAGSDVYIGERDSNVFVQASAAPTAAVAKTGVQNAGTIHARRAFLGAGDLYAVGIENSGIITGRQINITG